LRLFSRLIYVSPNIVHGHNRGFLCVILSNEKDVPHLSVSGQFWGAIHGSKDISFK
jgi:hypothetical protein